MYQYRVCFADTDAAGIVYHARYFEIAERSRAAVMREIGIDTTALFRGRTGYGLVVHNLAARFVTPAFADDFLDITTWIPKHGPARTCWRTEVRRGEVAICSLDVNLVCLDLTTKIPTYLPEFLDGPISALAARGQEAAPCLAGV